MSGVYVKATNIPQVYDYDLTSNSLKYYSTLSESNIHKFYIPAKYSQKVEFRLKSSSSFLNFDTIYIKEYEKRDSTSELSKTSIDPSYNSSIYSYSYIITDSSCNYVALEIRPSSELSKVSIVAEVESVISWVVVFIILSIIICIIALLGWYFITRNKKKEISNENLSPSTQSLYPLQ